MAQRRHVVSVLIGTGLMASLGRAAGEDAAKQPDAAGKARPFSVFASGLAEPRGLLFGLDGTLYVAEQRSGTIAAIGVDGKIARIAKGLSSPHDLARDGQGNLYVAETGADRISKLTRSGNVTSHIENLESPVDLDFAPDGELWVCELTGNVRAFATPAKSRTVVRLAGPHGLAFTKSSAVFINDWRGNRVVQLDAGGTARPFAELAGPVGLAFGRSGDLYVAQPQVHRVTRIQPDGTRHTFATELNEPRDPAFDRAGNLYLAETLAGRVLKYAGEF